MKIVLFGAEGQLGRRLRERLPGQGRLTALGRAGEGELTGDLLDTQGIARTLKALSADVIVNAAAYTAVDRAESDTASAFAVNARACEALAMAAEATGAWLIHFSTDYVFDGSGDRPWTEDDAPSPVNAYGRSKLAGEEAIAANCSRYVILRTSWLFDSRAPNFLTSILDAARTRGRLEVPADQVGSPTHARDLAGATSDILPQLAAGRAGTYHVCSAGEISRLGYARHILATAGALGWRLRASPADVHPRLGTPPATEAPRPRNSRLSTRRAEKTWGVVMPPWQTAVEAAIREIGLPAYKP